MSYYPPPQFYPQQYGSNPLSIIVILAVIAAAGYYYYTNFMQASTELILAITSKLDEIELPEIVLNENDSLTRTTIRNIETFISNIKKYLLSKSLDLPEESKEKMKKFLKDIKKLERVKSAEIDELEEYMDTLLKEVKNLKPTTGSSTSTTGSSTSTTGSSTSTGSSTTTGTGSSTTTGTGSSTTTGTGSSTTTGTGSSTTTGTGSSTTTSTTTEDKSVWMQGTTFKGLETDLFLLVLQGDGNLVIYTKGGPPVWGSNTHAGTEGPYSLSLSSSGTLLVNAKNGPVWASLSAITGVGPYFLKLTNTGNLQIIDSTNSVVWMQTDGYTTKKCNEIVIADFPQGRCIDTENKTFRFVNIKEVNDLMFSKSNLKQDETFKGLETDRFVFVLQGDGNLVIYKKGGPAVWSSNTHSRAEGPFSLSLKADGNLVLYAKNGTIWSSNSRGVGPFNLELKNNGNLQITDSTNAVTWQSNSAQPEPVGMPTPKKCNALVLSDYPTIKSCVDESGSITTTFTNIEEVKARISFEENIKAFISAGGVLTKL